MWLYNGPNYIKFIGVPRGLLSLGRHNLNFVLSWRNEIWVQGFKSDHHLECSDYRHSCGEICSTFLG